MQLELNQIAFGAICARFTVEMHSTGTDEMALDRIQVRYRPIVLTVFYVVCRVVHRLTASEGPTGHSEAVTRCM
jgi:hypothetical protein